MKTFEYYLLSFEKHLQGLGREKQTVKGNLYIIRQFIIFAKEQGKNSVAEITPLDITDFVEHIKTIKTRRKEKMKPWTVRKRISDLRSFFRFLYRNEVILQNPMDDIVFPVKENIDVNGIFTQSEMGKFLDCIDVNEPRGTFFRSRGAIYQKLY